MTLTERIDLMRRLLAQMRVIRARLNPLVLAQAKRAAEEAPAKPRLRAEALRRLAVRPTRSPDQAVGRRRSK